jgi:hypothetical protein
MPSHTPVDSVAHDIDSYRCDARGNFKIFRKNPTDNDLRLIVIIPQMPTKTGKVGKLFRTIAMRTMKQNVTRVIHCDFLGVELRASEQSKAIKQQ